MNKKFLSIITSLALSIFFIAPITVYAVRVKYVDSDTQLSFMLPADWNPVEISKDCKIVKAKFAHNNSSDKVLMYGSADIYNGLSSSEKQSLKRSKMNNSYFTEKEISEYLGLVDDGKAYTSVCKDDEYYIYNTISNAGFGYVSTAYYLKIYNGYMFMYIFYGASDEEISAVIESADYLKVPSGEKEIKTNNDISSVNSSDTEAINMIIGTAIAFLLYSLPIIIYVFALKKPKLTRRKAKKAVIIYGVCSFIGLFILKLILGSYTMNVIPAFICAYINYKILAEDEIENTNQLFESQITETYIPENMILKINIYDNKADYSNTEDTTISNKSCDDVAGVKDSAENFGLMDCLISSMADIEKIAEDNEMEEELTDDVDYGLVKENPIYVK